MSFSGLDNDLDVPEEEHASATIELDLDLGVVAIGVLKYGLVLCATLMLAGHLRFLQNLLIVDEDGNSAWIHIPGAEIARF